MNILDTLYHAFDNAEADLAEHYVGERVKELIAAGIDPLSLADACMTSSLALAAARSGDDLEARKLLVQWHRLTRELA